MNQKRLWTVLTVVLGMLVVWTFVGNKAPESLANKASGHNKETLTWGGPKNISMIPIIAEKKGYFDEQGLTVNAQYVRTGKVAMDAVISGDLDFGIIVDTNIAFVKYQKGADINVIASIAEKFDDAIMARSDMGINKPKDLEGKTLAILPGTTSHRFADLFIDYYKLDRSKITFMNLSPPSIQAAVINGDVPAGSIWEPYRYNVQQQLGSAVLQFNDKNIYKAYSLVAVRKNLLNEKAEQAQSFLKALIKAEDFIRTHKDEAIEILAKELDMDVKILHAIWDDYILKVKLDRSLVKVFEDEALWIQKRQRGFENRKLPSYQDVLAPEVLREIDESRVQ